MAGILARRRGQRVSAFSTGTPSIFHRGAAIADWGRGKIEMVLSSWGAFPCPSPARLRRGWRPHGRPAFLSSSRGFDPAGACYPPHPYWSRSTLAPMMTTSMSPSSSAHITTLLRAFAKAMAKEAKARYEKALFRVVDLFNVRLDETFKGSIRLVCLDGARRSKDVTQRFNSSSL